MAHLVSERDQHQQNTAKINKLKLFCTVRELKKHVSDDHEKSEEEIEAKMVNMMRAAPRIRHRNENVGQPEASTTV